ncbi:MAG: hypothetical protein CMH12_04590 [Maritimibacter sp.]|nr:hypothetical protein [Maritimibacter sp.]
MADVLKNIGGVPVLACGETGVPLGGSSGLQVVLGEASTQGARAIVVPVARLSADFFDPATGIADTVQRTLAARKLPLAFLGDRPAGVGDSHMFFKDIDALTAHVEADKAA